MIEGRNGAQCVSITFAILAVFELICSIDAIWELTLPPMTLAQYRADERKKQPDKEPQGTQEEVDDYNKLIAIVRYVFLVVFLLKFGLHCVAAKKSWESLSLCDANPEAALTSYAVARNMQMVVCAISCISLAFIPTLLWEGSYICCCLSTYQKGLQNEINRRQMMAGYMAMGQDQRGAPWPSPSNVVYPAPSNTATDPQYP